MPHGDVATFHQGGQWKTKVESGSEHSHVSRDEAMNAGRDLPALKVERTILRMEGTMGDRKTYGHDSRDVARLTSLTSLQHC